MRTWSNEKPICKVIGCNNPCESKGRNKDGIQKHYSQCRHHRKVHRQMFDDKGKPKNVKIYNKRFKQKFKQNENNR